MVRSAFHLITAVFQRLTCLLLIATALAVAGASIAASFGVLPWLTLPLTFGETTYEQAGMWVQIGVAVLAVSLLFYLPSNARVMVLENSHRRFHMTMKDVARAYALCHRADREGVFRLRGEFDAVRERLVFLRDHPDLSGLEPEVLEVAAQMSHVSQELADTYSDKAVTRARDFLTARQQEIERFNERIGHANQVACEMRQWAQRVALEEDVARSQLARLREELGAVMPELALAEAPAPRTRPELRQMGRLPLAGAMVHAAH